MFAGIVSLILLASPAFAVTQALEPQLRVHAGLSYIPGPEGFGVGVGLDTRLTRLVSLDFGGFVSPIAIDAAEVYEREDPRDYYHLRHGVYFAPGLRIPHAQPKAFAWELFLRGGAGVLWTADLNPDAIPMEDQIVATAPAMGGFGGADAFVRVDRVGLRFSAKVWMYEGLEYRPPRAWFMIEPQFGVEALYQW